MKNKLIGAVARFVQIAVFGIGLCAVVDSQAAVQNLADASADAALIKRGEYVAHLGDCIACHSAEKGQPMAGGRGLETPFGKLYSTNITPDVSTGIGAYTFAEFERAMRHGVAKDGHNLYPAMPYPSYAKMDNDDMRALYAYLMRGLPAVNVGRPGRRIIRFVRCPGTDTRRDGRS